MRSSKLQDTRSKIQNSIGFLWSNNEESENEIKKIIPFARASDRKYLGINLTKEV